MSKKPILELSQGQAIDPNVVVGKTCPIRSMPIATQQGVADVAMPCRRDCMLYAEVGGQPACALGLAASGLLALATVLKAGGAS